MSEVDLDTEFLALKEKVTQLPKRPDNNTLLELYALFKQATVGDVSGKRPGLLNPKGRAKFDAWTQKKGLEQQDAKQAYCALVKRLLAG